DRLMPYLMRGIWPFLVRLVVGLIITVPLMIMVLVLLIVGGAIAASANSTAILLFFQFVAFVISLAVAVLAVFVAWPAEIQAGLGREFNLPRVIAFVKDFNKRVFKELLLSVLFIMGFAIVAQLVGMAALCIGMYFTIAAVVMAQHHLFFQLYMLY